MKRLMGIVTIVAATLLPTVLSAQVDTAWARRYNGPVDSADYGLDVVVDAAGNVYVGGTSTGAGSDADYVLVKYDSTGVQQWVQRYNGPGNRWDQFAELALDNAGNVYVTGRSYGSGTGDDYATIKYNSDGDTQWVRRYNRTSNDGATAIAVDGAGNVYVTGQADNSSWNEDYGTVKYSSAGVQQWARFYNGPGDGWEGPYAIAVDGAGNVYVTGGSEDPVTSYDFATVKYDSTGAQQWARRYNGPPGDGYDEAYALAADSSGNVYVAGRSSGSSSGTDYATVKYNSAGDTMWVRRYNGTGNDMDYPSAMALDRTGNVLVTGFSVGASDDYLTIKYNSAGDTQWVRRYDRLGRADRANALAIDDSGNVYVTGHTDPSSYEYDYTTVKYGRTGEEQWAMSYNGTGNDMDWGQAIALDAASNVYVTGYSANRAMTMDEGYDIATVKYVRSSGGVEEGRERPLGFELDCRPNPVTSNTVVSYSLPAPCRVSIRLYDVTGRPKATLAQGHRAAGEYRTAIGSLRSVSRGVYLLRLEAGGLRMTRKLVIE